MSRDDLLAKNVQIVKDVSEKVAKYCPQAIVIVVSNPLTRWYMWRRRLRDLRRTG